MPTIAVDAGQALTEQLLTKAGASAEDAGYITQSVMWASLRGVDSHGFAHLPIYVQMYMGTSKLLSVNSTGSPRVTDGPSAVVAIDGNGCAGQRVMAYATDRVAAKARISGIGAASVMGCTHQGALGYYAEQLARQDMIGLIFVCSGSATPPFGGVERMLGTNPFAVSVPAGKHYPISIDMATSATTWIGSKQVTRALIPVAVPELVVLPSPMK